MAFGVDGLVADDDQKGWLDGIFPVCVLEQLPQGCAYAKARPQAGLDLVELEVFVAAGDQIDVAVVAVRMLRSDFGPFVYDEACPKWGRRAVLLSAD